MKRAFKEWSSPKPVDRFVPILSTFSKIRILHDDYLCNQFYLVNLKIKANGVRLEHLNLQHLLIEMW